MTALGQGPAASLPSYLEQQALAGVGDFLLPLSVQPGRQQEDVSMKVPGTSGPTTPVPRYRGKTEARR